MRTTTKSPTTKTRAPRVGARKTTTPDRKTSTAKVATTPKLRNGAIPKKILKDYVTRYAVVDENNRLYGLFRLEKNANEFVDELGIPLTVNAIAMDF